MISINAGDDGIFHPPLPLKSLLLALFIFAGINRKIIIHQRNGIDVCIYAKDKQLAQTFQSEINSII